jgi:hypothetical protein
MSQREKQYQNTPQNILNDPISVIPDLSTSVVFITKIITVYGIFWQDCNVLKVLISQPYLLNIMNFVTSLSPNQT